MTVAVPVELEDRLRSKAQRRRTSVDELVRQALEWYLEAEPELLDELDAWRIKSSWQVDVRGAGHYVRGATATQHCVRNKALSGGSDDTPDHSVHRGGTVSQ